MAFILDLSGWTEALNGEQSGTEHSREQPWELSRVGGGSRDAEVTVARHRHRQWEVGPSLMSIGSY